MQYTNASRLISAGVDVRTVAGRLGHANPSTTMNIYAHFYVIANGTRLFVDLEVYFQMIFLSLHRSGVGNCMPATIDVWEQ